MHEMSIAANLIEIIKQELEKHEAKKLLLVKVCHGKLANVVPEALHFAWEVVTKETPMEGATMELEEIPLRLKCAKCSEEFEPSEHDILLMPCPECGEDIGHEVISGKELYLAHLEAE